MPRFMPWISSAAVALAFLSLADEAAATRKGTRNYQPGAATSVANPGQQTTTSQDARALESCLAAWDAETHMTKDEWRSSCERIAKERAPKPET